MGVGKRIVIKAQPSTSSELPASRQYSSADAVNMILNDSPPENQFAADNETGEEIDTRALSSFNPSDTTDRNLHGVSVSFLHRQFSAVLWLSWPSVTRHRLAVGAVV